MSLKNYSKFYELCYLYLGYRSINRDSRIDLIINECLKELEELNSFKYTYQEYDYVIDEINKEPYLSYLDGSNYYLAAMTLGSIVDNRIKVYSMNDLLKMYIFDASASAYLECLSDEYEKTINPNCGYRFCPGYGGSNITDIKPLYKLLKANKIGIELLDSGLMIPQKSMIGIIKIGKSIKNCKNCINFKECNYLKNNTKCYIESGGVNFEDR